MNTLPSRKHGKRRDRHGRGLRGPFFPSNSPAYRTRAAKFDDILAAELDAFREHLGSRLARYDFAVLDVPASPPAPWEEGVPLARYLPFERPSHIHGRLIFYRMPITNAMNDADNPRLFIHNIIVDHIALVLNKPASEIDYLRN